MALSRDGFRRVLDADRAYVALAKVAGYEGARRILIAATAALSRGADVDEAEAAIGRAGRPGSGREFRTSRRDADNAAEDSA